MEPGLIFTLLAPVTRLYALGTAGALAGAHRQLGPGAGLGRSIDRVRPASWGSASACPSSPGAAASGPCAPGGWRGRGPDAGPEAASLGCQGPQAGARFALLPGSPQDISGLTLRRLNLSCGLGQVPWGPRYRNHSPLNQSRNVAGWSLPDTSPPTHLTGDFFLSCLRAAVRLSWSVGSI